MSHCPSGNVAHGLAARAFALWLVAAFACAGSPTPAAQEGPKASHDPAPPDPKPKPERAPANGPSVERGALLAVLAQGPGAFLQRIEVEAHFESGSFAGWRLLDLGASRDRVEALGIRRGDVITAINGYGLERPEYLHAVFVELRDAPAIVVEGERAGEPFEIRIPVEGDAGSP